MVYRAYLNDYLIEKKGRLKKPAFLIYPCFGLSISGKSWNQNQGIYATLTKQNWLPLR
jgi:hypothetical protein